MKYESRIKTYSRCARTKGQFNGEHHSVELASTQEESTELERIENVFKDRILDYFCALKCVSCFYFSQIAKE